MSTILNQVDRIRTNIANAYDLLINKYEASEPTSRNSDNLTTTINSLKFGEVSYDEKTGHLAITTK